MLLYARLGQKNRGDSDWRELDASTVHRTLECSIDEENKKPGYYYNCTALSLFELGSVHSEFYLLNVRIPTILDDEGTEITPTNDLGKLVDVHLVVIHQNGGFTKVRR